MQTAKVLNLSLIPHTSQIANCLNFSVPLQQNAQKPLRPAQPPSNTNTSKALETTQIEVFHCWLRFSLRSTLHQLCFMYAREGKLYVRALFELRRLISEYTLFFVTEF